MVRNFILFGAISTLSLIGSYAPALASCCEMALDCCVGLACCM